MVFLIGKTVHHRCIREESVLNHNYKWRVKNQNGLSCAKICACWTYSMAAVLINLYWNLSWGSACCSMSSSFIPACILVHATNCPIKLVLWYEQNIQLHLEIPLAVHWLLHTQTYFLCNVSNKILNNLLWYATSSLATLIYMFRWMLSNSSHTHRHASETLKFSDVWVWTFQTNCLGLQNISVMSFYQTWVANYDYHFHQLSFFT